MSFSQCLIVVCIFVVALFAIGLITILLFMPKPHKNKLSKEQQEELYQTAFEMDCIWAGKNILHQFIRQVSDILPKQEIINCLANSIKICNNNQEIKVLDISPSAGTDIYLQHAEDFYRGLVEEYNERKMNKR